MATIAMDVPDRQVSIGRVLGRAFGTIGGNPATTIGIAFLFGALPQTLVRLILIPLRANATGQANVLAGLAITFGSALLALAFYAIVQGSLVRATVDHDEGRRAGLGESMMAGLSVAVPLILMAIISGIAMMFGMVLLVVPGIILYLMWSVASSALVDERLGVFGALARSRSLTKGYRWYILGFVLLLFVVTAIVSSIGSVLVVAGTSFSVQSITAAQQSQSVTATIGLLVIGTFISVLSGVCHASLFVELRNAKDGPSEQALSKVFS